MDELTESGRELKTTGATREVNLRLEYQLAQAMATHYDNVNWTIGSTLIAGVFIMIGIIGDSVALYPYLALFSFIALLVWRLYYRRHKEIQRVKFKRLHEIEAELGMEQHLRVDRADKEGRTWGLRGDHFASMLTLGIPGALTIVYLIWRLSAVGPGPRP